MIRIKDVYISTKDIKKISMETEYGLFDNNRYYMVINYAFDNEPVKIEVNDFEEYEIQAGLIAEVINKYNTVV